MMNAQTIQKNQLQQTYSITQLCKELSMTPRALRLYEQRNLLAPQRHQGRRRYSAADRDRLQLILRAKRWGFTLAEIANLLEHCDKGDGTLCTLWSELPKLREQLRVLKQQRQELSSAIEDLEHTCSLLTETVIYVPAD